MFPVRHAGRKNGWWSSTETLFPHIHLGTVMWQLHPNLTTTPPKKHTHTHWHSQASVGVWAEMTLNTDWENIKAAPSEDPCELDFSHGNMNLKLKSRSRLVFVSTKTCSLTLTVMTLMQAVQQPKHCCCFVWPWMIPLVLNYLFTLWYLYVMVNVKTCQTFFACYSLRSSSTAIDALSLHQWHNKISRHTAVCFDECSHAKLPEQCWTVCMCWQAVPCLCFLILQPAGKERSSWLDNCCGEDPAGIMWGV